MVDDKDLKQAKLAYASLCEYLDEHNWHYEKIEEDLSIKCGAQGDDLPMEIVIEVDKIRKIISLLSYMPFAIPEKRRAALAIAVSQANNGMADGSFDYNYLTGEIVFRMTSSYRESLIGKGLFEYMLLCACYTIDNYNDKFLMVAKNEMSPEEILEFIQ